MRPNQILSFERQPDVQSDPNISQLWTDPCVLNESWPRQVRHGHVSVSVDALNSDGRSLVAYGGSDGLWLRIMQGEPVRIPLDNVTAPLAKPARPSKLTIEQSHEIVTLAASGASLRDLAARYAVSHETVRKALARAR